MTRRRKNDVPCAAKPKKKVALFEDACPVNREPLQASLVELGFTDDNSAFLYHDRMSVMIDFFGGEVRRGATL